MPYVREAVLVGDPTGPLADPTVVELHHAVAAVAGQVVVVPRCAPTPARAVPVLQRVDEACLGERAEGAVDRRQAERAATCPQLLVERLRRHVAVHLQQRVEHVDALARGAQACTAQLLGGAGSIVAWRSIPHARQGSRWTRYMRSVIICSMIAFSLAVLAAVGFVIATLLVDSTLGTSRRFHHLSVVIAAGILLGVAFADIVPETFELLGAMEAAFAIATGFLALFLVEALTGGHTHHHEPHGVGAHAHAHAHSHAPVAASSPTAAGDPCVPSHRIVPFLVGLGIHNVADGLVIGASHEASDAAATGVAVGLLVHQVPVGLSFAAVLVASGVARSRMHRNAALIAALIPVGTLVVLLAPELADRTLGALIGVAAGALLYIAAGHLLPEAQSEERRPVIAAAFATSLLATILFVGTLHDAGHGEEHGHGDEAHEEETDHADEDDDHA